MLPRRLWFRGKVHIWVADRCILVHMWINLILLWTSGSWVFNGPIVIRIPSTGKSLDRVWQCWYHFNHLSNTYTHTHISHIYKSFIVPGSDLHVILVNTPPPPAQTHYIVFPSQQSSPAARASPLSSTTILNRLWNCPRYRRRPTHISFLRRSRRSRHFTTID